MNPLRVVVDTNVLVSAAIVDHGPSARVFAASMEGRIVLIISVPLLSELTRTLSLPRIVRRLPDGTRQAARTVGRVRAAAELVDPQFTLDIVKRDPADNRVVEAAVAGNTDYIVSGDADLLSLSVAAGIPVVSPALLLEILAGRS